MTKKELIADIAEKTGITKKEAEVVINTTLNTIIEKVTDGEEVSLAGFGKFEKSFKKGRSGINPLTKEPMTIADKHAPKFKPASAFKKVVNGEIN